MEIGNGHNFQLLSTFILGRNLLRTISHLFHVSYHMRNGCIAKSILYEYQGLWFFEKTKAHTLSIRNQQHYIQRDSCPTERRHTNCTIPKNTINNQKTIRGLEKRTMATTITQVAMKGESLHIKTSQAKNIVDMFVDIMHRNTTCTLPSRNYVVQTNTRNWDKVIGIGGVK